jgi:hypothetical protein
MFMSETVSQQLAEAHIDFYSCKLPRPAGGLTRACRATGLFVSCQSPVDNGPAERSVVDDVLRWHGVRHVTQEIFLGVQDVVEQHYRVFLSYTREKLALLLALDAHSKVEVRGC